MALAWAPGAQTALSPAEARGKQIYLSGTGADGRDIPARVGSQDIALPASAVPCVSCHGSDGLGRPEGGVVPTDIRWRTLARPYGAVASGARRHPPYTRAALARALSAGVDPAGNRLDASMPRYALATQEVADLLAYLRRIDSDLDPGLTATHIVIGTVLPDAGPMAGLGGAMRALMEAYFADLNRAGGIYGRALQLRAVGGADSAALLAAADAQWQGAAQPFAVLASYTGGRDLELGRLAEAQGMPLLGTFTPAADEEAARLRSSFYLFGGLAVQARALVDHAAVTFAPARVAVVYPRDDERVAALAGAVRAQAARHGWDALLALDYPRNAIDAERIAAQLKASATQAVFFLGTGTQFRLLTEAAFAHDWEPFVFVLSALIGNEVFSAPLDFEDRVFIAFPTAGADYSPAGVREFEALHRRHGLERRYMPAQLAVYAATKSLATALKHAGRDLTRAKLIAALEAFYEFETGLTPPLTYSANRHIGALGAHVLAVDLGRRRLSRDGHWVTPR